MGLALDEKRITHASKPWLDALFAALIMFGLYLVKRYSYPLFHGLSELFSIVIACGIFMIAWNTRRFFTNNYFFLVGIAYLFIGFIDTIHTFAYKGMGIFRGYDSNLPTQLWIAARYVGSITLLLAPFFTARKLRAGRTFMAYSVVSFLLLFAIFYRIFPDCFIEGQGLTAFKVTSEYIISAILLVSLVFLYQKRTYFDPYILKLLTASTVTVIASEMSFTLYTDVYGFSNMLGHVLKIVSFYLIYKAIIVTGLDSPYSMLFRDLKIERDKAQQYLDVAGVMFIAIDTDQKVMLINRKGCEVLGYEEHEVVGMNWFDTFLPERLRDVVRASFLRLLAGEIEAVEFYENPVLTKAGDERLIAWHNTVFYDENGHVTGTLGSGEDITERKRTEKKLNESEVTFRAISASAYDAIIIMDNDGIITYWNKAAERIFGYTLDEAIGKELHTLLVPQKYYQSSTKGLDHFKKTGEGSAVGKTLELSALRKDGTEFPVELSLSAVYLQNRWSAIGILRDITDRKQLEEKLQVISLTDELTGLYNRRGFITLSEQQLKMAERTKKDMLLFFADLDKMKQINDTLGHQEGDKALFEIATILKEVFRESDIIGRMGGDEFAILAIDTTDETRDVLIKRLRNILDNYNKPEGRNYQLSLSTGIAHYNPETPSTLDELMAQADTLMYEEKRNKQH